MPTTITSLLLLLATVGASAQPSADMLAKMPAHMLLHAPFTPFTTNSSLNATAEVIGQLASQAQRMSVNTIFVGGSMGQFDALTTAERKTLMTAWVVAAKPLRSLYVICQVGDTAIETAIELARHAASTGCDAIASVPPYYEKTDDADTIVDFLQPISAGAPALPLFFYHIPAITGCHVKVSALLRAAAAKLPALAGVKWVGTDLHDWFDLTRDFNRSHALLFAPEPKLASFALGMGRGAVLAEDFFAPTYARMRQGYFAGGGGAADEQAWKLKALSILSKYGGATERVLYRKLCSHVDMGPPRLPQHPMAEEDWPKLVADLDAIGFWDDKAVCAAPVHAA